MLREKLVAIRKKYGYSQQELADKLNVTRQTISNWECGQGAPTLDKAAELANIYNVTLNDLVEEQVDIVIKKSKKFPSRLLKELEGKIVKMSCSDMEFFLTCGLDTSYKVKILEVNEDWLRIEYERAKENSLFKKETVIQLIDINAVDGFEIMEE